MLSLAATARFPLLAIITMRGEWAEFNQWQNPMGQATEPALKLMGALTWRVERAEDAGPTVAAAARMAFNGDQIAAVILSQRLICEKEWVK